METGMQLPSQLFMITFTLISLALVCLGWLAFATLGFTRRANSFEELEESLCIVDLKAFRTLTDTAETQFLRMNLGRSQFRRAERLRIQAAMGYLRMISANAKTLLAIGTLAKKTEDGHIQEAAQQLIDTAMRTRRTAARTVSECLGLDEDRGRDVEEPVVVKRGGDVAAGAQPDPGVVVEDPVMGDLDGHRDRAVDQDADGALR